MKIVFYISSLKAGGAERVVSRLSSQLVKKGYDVSIVTLWDKLHDFYPLDPAVKRVVVGYHGGAENIFKRIQKIFLRLLKVRRALLTEEPDIVLSFLGKSNLIACFSCIGVNVPLIISERSQRKLKYPINILQYILYYRASALVSVSEGVSKDFFWLPKNKKSVIYNPISWSRASEKLELSIQKKLQDKEFFLSVGSLRHVKGYDLLLASFAKVHKHYPAFYLFIAGEGNLKEELELLANKYQINKTVIFLGNIINIKTLLDQSFCYVLSSRNEGFPNALIEAMSVGAPCISFDCPHGPNEIITHNHDGLLVPPENIEKLTEAMCYMIEHPEERARMGNNALAINERLHIDKITAQWEEVIQATIR